MRDCEFPKLFPKLTLFKVMADGWNKKFAPIGVGDLQVQTRAVATLESSLGIKSITPFIIGQLHTIDFWKPTHDGHPERYFNSMGILFADTGQVYVRNTLEQFQEDYLIARLAGLRQ